MLTSMKVRCVNCKQSSYFYVHTWKGKVYAAIYTECPKCHKFDDVYHLPIDHLEKYLKDVLAGNEILGSSIKRNE